MIVVLSFPYLVYLPNIVLPNCRELHVELTDKQFRSFLLSFPLLNEHSFELVFATNELAHPILATTHLLQIS